MKVGLKASRLAHGMGRCEVGTVRGRRQIPELFVRYKPLNLALVGFGVLERAK